MNLMNGENVEECLLCLTGSTEFFFKDKFRTYRNCHICSLIFVPRDEHVSSESEKARYEEHNNDPNDGRYRKFLERITFPIKEHFTGKATGLDFGCGNTTLLADILREGGYEMEIYDLFYADYKSVLEKKYDFIVTTEVVEHLRNPLKVFEKLFSCLKPNGRLAVMTRLYDDSIDFKTWHYKNDRTHICFYSIAALDWLATNLDVIFKQTESDIFVFKKDQI